MTFVAFGEYRPDVNDFRGQHTQVLSGVLPRGDGYGPFPDKQAFSSALPATSRGEFSARKSDGTIVIFAGTLNRLYRLDNTTLTWIPVSKVTALTSISNASPAVFTLNNHGLSNGDPLVLSTTGALPTGLTVGTVYYVINATTNDFNVSTSVGGSAVNTSSAGSGTHSFTDKYSDLPSTDNWQFLPFGDNVVAINANTAPQVYNMSSSTAFADLGGSPPTARYGAVVGRFIALFGLVSNPNRVHWCDIDGITTWTAGTGFANYVDLPDGGVVRGGAGGEFGVIIQESAIRRLVYVPGAKPAFQIERLAEDVGLLGAYSIVRAGERVLFISQQGVKAIGATGTTAPVGKERVDRTLLADIDTANLNLLIGAGDPAGTRAFWAYKSVGSSDTAAFDKIISYDTVLDRWSPPIAMTGEYIAPAVKPGLTLDALDSVSGSIDALGFSLDSVQAALSARLSIFDTSHQMGFFDGSNLEAILETAEQSIDGRRVRVRGFEPRTDAVTAYGSIRYRDNAQASLSQTTEIAINSSGNCPQNIDTKLARARLRIPAGETWTYAMGVEPDFAPSGKR